MDAQKAALDAIIKFARGLLVKGRQGAPGEGSGEEAPAVVEAISAPEEAPAEEPEACEMCGSADCECEPEASADLTIVKAGKIGPPKSRGKMPVPKKKFGGF